MDRMAVYCPNARDERKLIELRGRFGAESYDCGGLRHSGHSDFVINVNKTYLDCASAKHYLYEIGRAHV